MIKHYHLPRLGYQGHGIMAVWLFKRKRNPFGVITKYRVHLCAHDGQTQKGVHYNESYSPIVSCPAPTHTCSYKWLALQPGK
jgi:hypothetical protein